MKYVVAVSYKLILLALLNLSIVKVYANTTIKTNPSTKLVSYQFIQNGFKLDLIQRLPDQTRAFFMARGFSAKVANNIGLSCIFQGIGTNITDAAHPESIEVSLKDWRIHVNKKITTIKMKESWDNEWVNSTVNNASRIAYKWATFPSTQRFVNSGDYGWGMISFNLPPKTLFDLEISWKQNNKQYHAWIKNLECPDDR